MGVDRTGCRMRGTRPEGRLGPAWVWPGPGKLQQDRLLTGAESSALPPLPWSEERGAGSLLLSPTPSPEEVEACGRVSGSVWLLPEPKGPCDGEQGLVSVHVRTNRCVSELRTPLAVLTQRLLEPRGRPNGPWGGRRGGASGPGDLVRQPGPHPLSNRASQAPAPELLRPNSPTYMTPSLVFSAASVTPCLVFSTAPTTPSLAMEKPFLKTSMVAGTEPALLQAVLELAVLPQPLSPLPPPLIDADEILMMQPLAYGSPASLGVGQGGGRV